MPTADRIPDPPPMPRKPKGRMAANRDLPPPSDPMAVARELLIDHLDPATELPTLRHWRGSWMRWDGPAWRELEERTIRAEVYQRLEYATYVNAKGETCDWAPNRRKMGDLLEAIAAISHLPQGTQPPIWLNPGHGPTAMVACTNGLLDIATRTMREHTPNFFNEIAVPFDFDADSREPTEWLEFLDELWPDDAESITLLQQWFGYILSGDTGLQKILGLLGPIRSGKGTICRVLRALVGSRNVTAPTLSSFGQNFGLQDLIGKPVAIIGDVRLGGSEQHAVVERLLTISGEDTITIDRKYRDPWTGQLPTRIMFVSNELPRFGDASGAIATRCVILETTRSWLGREDRDLTARLLGQLPAILNWSLDGLKDLSELGRFTEPQASLDAVTALADLVSPISAFLRDCCDRHPELEVPCAELYRHWRNWAEDNGQRPGSAQTFGRNLRSVISGLRVGRPRIGPDDSQVRVYVGVAPKPPNKPLS
jgi:putative DNA primase/helicase